VILSSGGLIVQLKDLKGGWDDISLTFYAQQKCCQDEQWNTARPFSRYDERVVEDIVGDR